MWIAIILQIELLIYLENGKCQQTHNDDDREESKNGAFSHFR